MLLTQFNPMYLSKWDLLKFDNLLYTNIGRYANAIIVELDPRLLITL